MGQGKQKKAFFSATERALATLGQATDTEVHSAVLELCKLTGARWFNAEDSDIAALYARALESRNATVRNGLTRFLDALTGSLWPSRDSTNPELDLFVGIACQVLPTFCDVIGDVDEVQPLQTALTQALSLSGCRVQVDPGVYDADIHAGWPGVLASMRSAKEDPARTQGPRQCFRFSTGIAAAPVTRFMWARLSFDTEVDGMAALEKLSTPLPLNLQLPLPYTVRSVTQAGADQHLAGFRLLGMGLPFSTLQMWAFHEGESELRAALASIAQHQGCAPQDVRARVVVVEQPSIALPEGVLGADEAARTVGKSDPQVQVLFARKSDSKASAGVLPVSTLGRALFARASSRTLEPTVRAAVQTLGALGLTEVELGKLS